MMPESTRQHSAHPLGEALLAFVVDLDGVVTRTAALHKRAWKSVFDELLESLRPDGPPFDEREDYLNFVDGKPRLEGARSFLESRGIEIPEGEARDTLADGTVHGVGNTKNERFHALLEKQGAEVFQDAVRAIKGWRREGFPVAIVSSSRNCRHVLETAGLLELFDARVDGETLDEEGLAGKPAPDMYVEAAEHLGVAPAQCAVLEDATAGVEAARRGGFGLIVGVDRDGGRSAALREHGADLVVSRLDETDLTTARPRGPAPRLLDRPEEFTSRLDGSLPALFLDYDGTLTPIVDRPEDAVLDDAMRSLLRRVAGEFTVAVVSGRDLEDVEKRVGIEGIAYAGSHGFDIRDPGGERRAQPEGEQALPALDAAEEALRDRLESSEGVQVERKRFAIAVHYRNAPESSVHEAERAVDEAIATNDGLRKTGGKAIFELRPDVDWDKGRAVLSLIESLGVGETSSTPVYIGDDTTDEDAFSALYRRGIGVLVSEEDRRTAAEFRLRSVEEVKTLLRRLVGDRPRHKVLESA